MLVFVDHKGRHGGVEIQPSRGARRAPGVALFVVGPLRATVADGGWLKNGVEMLTVGVLAATVSYAVGALVAPLAGG